METAPRRYAARPGTLTLSDRPAPACRRQAQPGAGLGQAGGWGHTGAALLLVLAGVTSVGWCDQIGTRCKRGLARAVYY